MSTPTSKGDPKLAAKLIASQEEPGDELRHAAAEALKRELGGPSAARLPDARQHGPSSLVNTIEALQPNADGWYELTINEEVRKEIADALWRTRSSGARTPVAWYRDEGGGMVFIDNKPSWYDDTWKPLYAAPSVQSATARTDIEPFRDELINLLERWERGSLEIEVFAKKIEGVLKAIRSADSGVLDSK